MNHQVLFGQKTIVEHDIESQKDYKKTQQREDNPAVMKTAGVG